MHSDPYFIDLHDAYCKRHGVKSASILTVTDDETASLIANTVAERISGKTVVEIGGGIGILAFHFSVFAKRVFCIEADPMWTEMYLALLHRCKPKNVTFIFGAAQEVVDVVRGDVALFCTHSDHAGLTKLAGKFAPTVIDVYKEILGDDHWSMKADVRRDGSVKGSRHKSPDPERVKRLIDG